MNIFDISHWTISNGRTGLLLFAQSLEELLFSHSHDSYKAPTLNFHYICYEMLHVIKLIEINVLDKGNLIPLILEMKQLFEKDIIAQKFLGTDINAIFSKKNNKGNYDIKPLKMETGKEIDENLPTLKKGLEFIINELTRNDIYLEELINEIKHQISLSNSDNFKLNTLYDLTKTTASELINMGFSQQYIYDCIIQTFFNSSKEVKNLNCIDEFFNLFDDDSHVYSVYMPINSVKQVQALKDYGGIEIAENVYEMFDPSIPYILKFKCKSHDPYRAREDTLDCINFALSINQFIKHTKYNYNPKYTDVVDIDNNKLTFIKKPEPSILSSYTKEKIIEKSELLSICRFIRPKALFTVLQLHSLAITSQSPDNQLINLWTAVEVVVPLERKDGLSRINQISNAFTTALCQDYFSGLLNQLYLDIKSVDNKLAEKIESIKKYKSINAKLLAIILFQEHSTLYSELTSKLSEIAPILCYRIEKYKGIWVDTVNVKKAYISHSQKLSQQIMRIYRTRNMLVHDGSALPYSNYVLQNLHNYLDSFVLFLSKYSKLGYTSIESIIGAAQFKEQQYLMLLKSKETIDESNIFKYILIEN